jgi:conjugal transfer ATP-binding protein TraC
MALFSFLFGDGGLTKPGLDAAAKRNKFSDYLPYIAYDPESRIYLNSDDTIGMLWECAPTVFSGERTIMSMEGLIRVPFPKGAILQFILHADPHIEPILKAYQSTKVRQEELFREVAQALTDHFRQGAKGEWSSGHILRNFRLFIAVNGRKRASVIWLKSAACVPKH